jgi:hypothetical protein
VNILAKDYHDGCKQEQVTLEAWNAAISQCLRVCKHFPSLADILEQNRDITSRISAPEHCALPARTYTDEDARNGKQRAQDITAALRGERTNPPDWYIRHKRSRSQR